MSLDFPIDLVEQYFREKNLGFPENDIKELFTWKEVTELQETLKSHIRRHSLLAVYSNMKELVIDAKGPDDMEKCVTVMTSLFEAFSEFSNPTTIQDSDVYDDSLYKFRLIITECEEIRPETYKRLMKAIEDPGELDFLGMTTLKIPGRPYGPPSNEEGRIVIGYAVNELIVENLGEDFRFEDWFVVHATARVKKWTISYTRVPKLYVRFRNVLTPFFTSIQAFHLTKSLTLANVKLKIEGKKSFDTTGWKLPNADKVEFKNVHIYDRRPGSMRDNAGISYKRGTELIFDEESNEGLTKFFVVEQ